MRKTFWCVTCITVTCGMAFVGLVRAMAAPPPTEATEGERAAEPAPALSIAWQDTTLVYKSGVWELRIKYLQKGTRSEGQDGKLFKEQKAVEPKQAGALLDTPFGKLKHYGKQRRSLWDVTGWNFADKKQIKRSEHVKPTQASSAP